MDEHCKVIEGNDCGGLLLMQFEAPSINCVNQILGEPLNTGP